MASQGSNDFSYQKASVVRGHHIYKTIWTPTVGETLQLRAEDTNEHDEHAIAVIKSGTTVGHVPHSMSRGGHISCQIVGQRKFGKGLEVPCIYTFTSSSSRMIEKLKLLQEEPESHSEPLSCPH